MDIFTIFRPVYISLLGIVAFPFLVIFILLCVPIFVFRFIVAKLSKFVRPDLAKMVTAAGHFFAVENMDKRSSRCVITLTTLFDGDLSLEEFQDLWLSRVVSATSHEGHLKYPELQQYITPFALFKFWKQDPSFDIANHITHCPFPQLQEKLSCEKGELHKIHEYLHNKPFPSKRSPWEIIVIRNYPLNNKESISTSNVENIKPLTLAAFRFHHSLMDGYSLQNILATDLVGIEPLQNALPKIMGSRSVSGKQVMKFIFAPFRLFYEASQFLETGMQRNVPWLVKDEEKMWRQVVGLTPLIPINSIKEIKNFHGVSFTSVLVSVITGAVRTTLIKLENSVSKNPEIPASLVLPVFPHSTKLRNQFTSGFIHLPIDECDPSLRLKKCHEIMERAKSSAGPLLGQCMMTIVGSLIHPLLKPMSMNRMIPIVISNFPTVGVEMKMGLDGKKVLEMSTSAGSARGFGGVFILPQSYGGTIRFSITAEQALFSQSDVDQLAVYITKEIAVLESETS